MADNFKVLKIRYTFKEKSDASSIMELMIKNLNIVLKAQDPNYASKEKTIKFLMSQMVRMKYIDIKLFINNFKIVINNSFEKLGDVNEMDSVGNVIKPFLAFQGKAIGATGELTRKMFTGTTRKEYQFDFGIYEGGDGRGLFNYLFLTLIGYPMGNIGWNDNVTPKYYANLAVNKVGSAVNKASSLLKKNIYVQLGTQAVTGVAKYGIYNNHTVFAIPSVDISIQDYFTTGNSDPRYLNVDNVQMKGVNVQFVTEKSALIKPTLSDVNVSLEKSTNDYQDIKTSFRYINGYISFAERNITNYEHFRNNFHGLRNQK